ncbi:retrovirus-related pol polyprotein from transposon TNT 1-94 [Tanacetum coccineum]
MTKRRSKEAEMTRTAKVIGNVLVVEIQIIISENVRNHQRTRTKELSSDVLGVIAVKKMMKRLKTKRVSWKHLARMDHGREFDNELQFGEFCNANGITHNFSDPHTPHSNGMVEKKNRTLFGIKRLHDDLRVNTAKVRVTAAKHNLVLLVILVKNMLSSYYCLYTVSAAGIKVNVAGYNC